ncbi:MAG: hypothetical protein HKN08_05535 [Gammaproteobacteria bacterium]|nr:hypothetical protein [Gammaproteobacteria bacterium]
MLPGTHKESVASRRPLFLIAIILCCLSFLKGNSVQAQGYDRFYNSFNLYPKFTDVQTDYDTAIDTLIVVNERFSYFGYINLRGVSNSNKFDFNNSEQSFRWAPFTEYPVDLVYQHVLRKGPGNDNNHLGLRWRISQSSALQELFSALNFNYSVQLFPAKIMDSSNRGGWQISHAFSMSFPYISDRLYLGGFMDQNFNENLGGTRRNTIVTETQLGFRLFKQLYAITEFRINQYRTGREDNIAIGIEWKLDL